MNGSTIQTILVAMLIFAFAAVAAAESRIYKTVDAQGNVIFTDIPPREEEAAEQIVVENPNSFQVEEALSNSGEQWIVEESAEGDAPEAAFSYSSLSIASPQDDEAVRENAGNITVVAVPSPRMRPGHIMRLLLDGSPVQEGAQATFSLLNVDRGTHTLTTEIVNGRGNVLIRSETTQFHMLRYAGGGR